MLCTQNLSKISASHLSLMVRCLSYSKPKQQQQNHGLETRGKLRDVRETNTQCLSSFNNRLWPRDGHIARFPSPSLQHKMRAVVSYFQRHYYFDSLFLAFFLGLRFLLRPKCHHHNNHGWGAVQGCPPYRRKRYRLALDDQRSTE